MVASSCLVLLLLVTVSLASPPAHLLVLSKFQSQFALYPQLIKAFSTERAAFADTLTVAHGSTFGGVTATSKLLHETPGVLAENHMDIQADTLSNVNFFPGLAAVDSLLPSLQAQMVVANLLSGLPNISPSTVVTTVGGVRVGFVGALTPADAIVIDPAILQNVTFDVNGWLTRFINARNALVASESPDYVVALLNNRNLQSPSDALAFVQPFASLFDVICLGLGIDMNYIEYANSTLVVSGSELGASYVKVDLATLTAVNVKITSKSPVDVAAVTESGLWNGYASCVGSASGVLIDQIWLGRSFSGSSNGLRVVRQSENPLIQLVMETMRQLTNAPLAAFNTGGIRDNLPSSFVPNAALLPLRPPSSKPPYETAVGDCIPILPSGDAIYAINVSSAELYRIAAWSVFGDPLVAGQLARNVWGAVRGISIEAIYYPNLTAELVSVKWPSGLPVNPTLTTDATLLALTDYCLGGGDGFPLLSQKPVLQEGVVDNDLLRMRLQNSSQGPLAYTDYVTGSLLLTRIEDICTTHSSSVYAMESNNAHVQVSISFVQGLAAATAASNTRSTNTTAPFCFQMSMLVAQAGFFLSNKVAFTTVNTALAPPSPYAIVVKSTNLAIIAGQLVGNPVNITVMLPAAAPHLSIPVFVCLPVTSEIEVYSRFVVPAVAVSIDGGAFTADPTLDVQQLYNATTGITFYCANLSIAGNRAVVVVPATTLSDSTYSPVEQAFLFLFGCLWIAFTVYAVYAVVHNVWVVVAQRELGHAVELQDFLKPAFIVRVWMVIIGCCRLVYFCLLPWGVLTNDVDPAASVFLFEFPFLLDLSIYCIFVQLFVSVFHWRVMRSVDSKILYLPLLIVNVLLFGFFFAVLGVYSLDTDPAVVSAFILAYRITIASLAFLIVLVFWIYGAVLLLTLRNTMADPSLKNATAPKWVAQMKRLLAVAVLASLGLLAIFIVIIYTATRSVPEPVFASVAWIIVFLFLAEMVPLVAIAHDLYRTAAVAEDTIKERTRESRSVLTRSSDGGALRLRAATSDNENPWLSRGASRATLQDVSETTREESPPAATTSQESEDVRPAQPKKDAETPDFSLDVVDL